MPYLRIAVSIISLFALSACGNLPAIPRDSNYAFETPGHFIVGIAQNDAGQASTLFAIQQGKEYIFLRTDSSDSILCSNLDGALSCTSKRKIAFKDDEKQTLLRVASQSVRRVLSREVSIQNPTITDSSTSPKFTLADTTQIINSLKEYFPERIEKKTDNCVTLQGKNEKEFVCYWDKLMPLYQYIETSDTPVMSARALFAYKDIEFTSDSMKKLYNTMIKEVQNN